LITFANEVMFYVAFVCLLCNYWSVVLEHFTRDLSCGQGRTGL